MAKTVQMPRRLPGVQWETKTERKKKQGETKEKETLEEGAGAAVEWPAEMRRKSTRRRRALGYVALIYKKEKVGACDKKNKARAVKKKTGEDTRRNTKTKKKRRRSRYGVKEVERNTEEEFLQIGLRRPLCYSHSVWYLAKLATSVGSKGKERTEHAGEPLKTGRTHV